MHFEWDDDKNLVNLAKHHVSFYEAQLAFADPQRFIARDIGHGDAIRIIGAGYWRKGKAVYEAKN